MGAQQVWRLSSMSTWIFVSFFLSTCSGMKADLSIKRTVFVAFVGGNLNINCELKIPANKTKHILKCNDPPGNEIYKCDISETNIDLQNDPVTVTVELKNLTLSGEYSCEYKGSKVYWFLRVTIQSLYEIFKLEVMTRCELSVKDCPQPFPLPHGEDSLDVVQVSKHCGIAQDSISCESRREQPMKWDYTELTVVTIFTIILLVFSVVGSVFVFRGHRKDCITGCGDTDTKEEERTEREAKEDNVDEITATSTSFYASLEPRPRSIYDELDLTAANREPDQSTAQPKKKEPTETIAQTTQDQHEGVFESVYENF